MESWKAIGRPFGISNGKLQNSNKKRKTVVGVRHEFLSFDSPTNTQKPRLGHPVWKTTQNQKRDGSKDPAVVPNRVRASTRTVIVSVARARSKTQPQIPPNPNNPPNYSPILLPEIGASNEKTGDRHEAIGNS